MTGFSAGDRTWLLRHFGVQGDLVVAAAGVEADKEPLGVRGDDSGLVVVAREGADRLKRSKVRD